MSDIVLQEFSAVVTILAVSGAVIASLYINLALLSFSHLLISCSFLYVFEPIYQ